MAYAAEIMHKTIEAIIDKNGRIQVVEDMNIRKPVRALITILEEAPKRSLGTETAYPLRRTSYRYPEF